MSILLYRRAPLKPDNFSKFKSEPDPKSPSPIDNAVDNSSDKTLLRRKAFGDSVLDLSIW